MSGNTGVKPVGSQTVAALKQGEFISGYGKTEKPRLIADRTITFGHLYSGRTEDLKANAATVAATGVFYIAAGHVGFLSDKLYAWVNRSIRPGRKL